MDENGFREFCSKRNLDDVAVRSHIETAREFATFLMNNTNKEMTHATPDDMQSYADHLIRNRKNTWENFLGLLRYSRFANNRQLEIALLELMDGSDVLENLSETLTQISGTGKRDEVFRGLDLPPLGTHSKEKPKVTRQFMEKLETWLNERECRELLSSGPHAVPKEEYLPEREKFLPAKSIDDFLEQRHREYVDELEKHMKEKTLYFTQEIDEEVLEYVHNTPTCQSGVRVGDVIYVTKIPYMAKKYLHEKDEKKRRYYYCHCSWVREAILSDLRISPNFCYCSAGFEKRPWDVIFDQPVKADIVETVLKGDPVCRFAIHIPQKFLESASSSRP